MVATVPRYRSGLVDTQPAPWYAGKKPLSITFELAEPADTRQALANVIRQAAAMYQLRIVPARSKGLKPHHTRALKVTTMDRRVLNSDEAWTAHNAVRNLLADLAGYPNHAWKSRF